MIMVGAESRKQELEGGWQVGGFCKESARKTTGEKGDQANQAQSSDTAPPE